MTRGKKSDLGIYIAPPSSEELERYRCSFLNGGNISTPRPGDGSEFHLFLVAMDTFSGYYGIEKASGNDLLLRPVEKKPNRVFEAEIGLPYNLAESDMIHYEPGKNGFNRGLVQFGEDFSQRTTIRRFSSKSFYENLAENGGFFRKMPWKYTTRLENTLLFSGENEQEFLAI
jgi:hypothetical protein